MTGLAAANDTGVGPAASGPFPARVDLAREPSLTLGPITLEPRLRRLAHRNGREESLEPRVMQVLVALARSPGQILTRDELFEACWHGVVVGEDAITRIIGKLRRLSEQVAADAFEIETISKVGYRLLLRPGHIGAAEAPTVSPGSSTPEGPLLAVLPFDNFSPDKEMDFFSDGVSEEIQQALSRSHGLRLIARSSAFQCRGADKAVANVAKQLGVSHFLDGSVRRSGARVRIAAQLIECASGLTLWSDRFDGGLDDTFALQDKIASSVSAALEVVLTPAPPGPPVALATHERFLRAQAIISEGGRALDESGAAATPLLEAVVREAPHHARAWELLANARAWTLRQARQPENDDERTARAKERARVLAAAETALRLDPGRGAAYEALALLQPWGAYAEREALLQRALRISPNEPGLLTAMSDFCWGVGRIREALEFAERACVQNPLLPAAQLLVTQMRIYLGDYEASLRLQDELRRHWPDNYLVLATELNYACTLGLWEYFDAAKADNPRWAHNARLAKGLEVIVAYGETVRSPEMAPRLRDLDNLKRRVGAKKPIGLNRLAQLCVYGLEAEALDLADETSFDHLFDPDGEYPAGIFAGVVFAPWTTFNRNPRFIGLCRRLGLCDYWIQTGNWPDCAGHMPYDFRGEAMRLGRS